MSSSTDAPVDTPDASSPAAQHAVALHGALQKYWGYETFRPLQREAMACVMGNRDSVVVLPTGGGKSLCFQAPAVCLPGTAVVVSPLISLMKDQVDSLNACGIRAAALNSTMGAEEKRQVSEGVRSGEIKLLYAAPERLVLGGMLQFLANVDVSFIAIDEAHCISSWGHDFRPEYRGLSRLKEVLPNARMHAYTATASEQVQQDIAQQLGLANPEYLVGSFDRPNLIYRVKRIANRLNQIREIVERRRGESGVIYCISRKEVEKTAAALVSLGVNAAPYHAGLSDQERHKNQEDFIEERIEVIVATVAFGMGIDKSNVRYVIHSGMPKSLENYQQESGRAGRDGLEADCMLLYSAGDAALWRRMMESSDTGVSEGAHKSLVAISNFCNSVACRHQTIVSYFGQELEKENCGACDVCLGELDLVEDPVVTSQKILSCVARLDQRYGGDYTAKVLVGSIEARIKDQRHDQLSTHGLLKSESNTTVRDWIEQLVGQGYLQKTGDYDVLQITDAGASLLRGKGSPRLLKPTKTKSSSRGAAEANWEGVDRGLFERLREVRNEMAAERSVPAYIVFGDASLRDMARKRPGSLETFRSVQGVGEKKLADFGERFVGEIVTYCQAEEVETDVNTVAVSPVSNEERPAVSMSAMASFGYFRQGKTIEETVTEMDRARSTVVGYLNQFLKAEGVTDPTTWVDAETANKIEAAIAEVGLKGLKPIYEQLGEEVDYDSIRIVATCVGNRELL